MKLGIYSDVHACYTSSIMPNHSNDSKYSVRLQMVIDTFKWMYEQFEKENVDLICNCGDLFDRHTVRAEELNAVSDAYKYSKGTKEIHIVGNHEILDTNRDFYSTALLSNFPFITICDSPMKIDDTISVLPYMRTEDITDALLRGLSNKVLLSHIDIMGSHLRADYIMDTGVNCELLAEYFDMTINGHLHTAEKMDTTKNQVWNIGSLTSSSFSDSNEYIPSICIYDTDTKKLKRINCPYAILFRRMTITSLKDLLSRLETLNNISHGNQNINNGKYRYILRVNAPYDIKDKVRDIINNTDNIIASKVTVIVDDNTVIRTVKTDKIDTVQDVKNEFSKFLDSVETLKYPINLYKNILDDVDVI